MAGKRWYWAVICWLFLLAASVYAQETTLVVGESTHLRIPGDSDVELSQKGVIDVQLMEGERWLITGLKPGVVALHAGDFRRIVKVVAPGREDHVKLARVPFKQDQLTQWLTPWFQVSLRSNGQALATANCQDRERADWERLANHLSGDLVTRGQLIVVCQQQLDATMVVIQAKAFYLKQMDAEKLGLEWHSPFKLTTSAPLKLERLPELHAYLAAHKAHMLGEPILRLRVGASGEMHSGSEMYFVQNDENTVWKRTGFQLQVKPLGKEQQSVDLEYAMSLSQPGSSQSIQSNSIKSRVRVPLATPVIVGQLDVAASGEEQVGLPGFSHIPILGPLFRYTFNDESTERIYLILMVALEDPAADMSQMPRQKL